MICPIKAGKKRKENAPGIILADTEIGLISVIPLTSNKLALRFQYTLEIKRSRINGLDQDSVALVFQNQTLDKKRFLTKIGVIEKEQIDEINAVLKDFFRLS